MPDVVTLLNHLPLNDEVPEDARPWHCAPPARAAEVPIQGWRPGAFGAGAADRRRTTVADAAAPALLPRLNLQSPLMQWMVAARKDSLDSEVIERMPKSAALKQSLLMAKSVLVAQEFAHERMDDLSAHRGPDLLVLRGGFKRLKGGQATRATSSATGQPGRNWAWP